MCPSLPDDRAIGVQHLDAILRVVTDFYVQAQLARAALDGKHAGEQLEQRGFARAVRADQHDALFAFGFEIHARDKRPSCRRRD